MAIQTINIGNQVNDGLGDDLRTAFQKVNANFATLDASLTITASNTIGTNGYGIFKQKADNNLEFKTITSGTKISITETDNTLIINNTEPYAFTRIEGNSGFVTASAGNLGHIVLQGSDDLDVSILGTTITVDTVLPITQILTTYDFGPLDGDYSNSVQLAISSSNIDFGLITLPGRVDLDLGNIAV